MRNFLFLSASMLAQLIDAQDKPAGLDTAEIISIIEQRMTAIDDAPVTAVFLELPGQEEAVRLMPDSSVRGTPDARDEIYTSPDGSIVGMGVYARSTHPGVTENSCYYFDPEGNTLAVWWRMKWTVSGCTDSVAVETRYVYFFPPGQSIREYATLTDGHGHDLDASTCRFPDIERHFDAYYNRDMLLLSKHIAMK